MKCGILIIAVVLSACTYDSLNVQVALEGKWVDVDTNTDTLTFRVIDGDGFMTLARGRQLVNGVLMPKSRSGTYQYKMLTDKISLYWMASSLFAFNDYYFEQKGDKIMIENFYDAGSQGSIQTFRKLN